MDAFLFMAVFARYLGMGSGQRPARVVMRELGFIQAEHVVIFSLVFHMASSAFGRFDFGVKAFVLVQAFLDFRMA